MHLPPVREVILTSGERLARDLRVDAALRMRQEGRKAWASPDIHSFRSWTQREWASCWPREQILHPTQELTLWLYAIKASGAADRQLSPMAAARQARQIGNLVEAYHIDPDPGRFAGLEESLFCQWHALVTEVAGKRGWMLEAKIPAALIELMTAGEWVPPERVKIIGMIHETPAQTELLEAMAARGTVVTRDDVIRVRKSRLTLLRPVNRRTQLRIAAQRIRDRLLSIRTRAEKEPPRIALIVPDLDSARVEVDAVLGEYLAPYTLVPGELRARRPWRYAHGRPLSEQPLVALALDLLALETRRNPMDRLSRILLDPLVFLGTSMTARADFELRLRRRGYWFSLPRVRALTERGFKAENDFAARFCRWLELYEATRPARALPSAWADWIQAILAAAQWGGDASTSVQTQALESWAEALDVLRAMDNQIEAINAAQMLVWIREILYARLFQPSVQHLQPVQVLAYDDALGGAYDEILVLDATVGTWPKVPRAVGLVSPDRMAFAGVPSSTPEGALADAQRWRDILLQMAPHVVVMAPAHDDGGGSLVPSPIIDGWPSETLIAEGMSGSMDLSAASFDALEHPTGEKVPGIGDARREDVRGGVSIFTAMAISPWVAFMRHRLGLSEFPVAVEGIEARHQGELMHRVLERFWTEVRTRDALLAIPPAELVEQIPLLVRQVQEADHLIGPEEFGPGLAALERLRMSALIVDWLAYERQRSDPFEVVLIEREIQTCIGGLNVSLRIDRVDRITCKDGSIRYLAIDYKSGSLLLKSWLDPDRLQQPQLPIYASFTDLTDYGIPVIDGVAWASVTEAGCSFIPLTNFCDALVRGDSDPKPGIADWNGRVAAWRFMLEREAESFMGGSLELNREKFRKDRFSRDLAPLVRPVDRSSPRAAFAGEENPF